MAINGTKSISHAMPQPDAPMKCTEAQDRQVFDRIWSDFPEIAPAVPPSVKHIK